MLQKTTKRVGVILSLFNLLIGLSQMYFDYVEYGDFFNYKLNIIVLLFALVLFVTSFYNIGRLIQVIVVFLAMILVIAGGENEGISMGLLVLFMLLIYKYEFLKKHPVRKVVTLFVLVFTALIFSIVNKYINNYDVYKGIATLIFFSVFIMTIFIVLYDEIEKYMHRESNFKEHITNLNIKLKETQSYLERVDGTFIDPVKAGLTKTEMVLLENLCIYRESNADLGKRLGKSPNTIKVQFTKIMHKIGADTRYQLIDLCKCYFAECPEDAPAEPEHSKVTQ